MRPSVAAVVIVVLIVLVILVGLLARRSPAAAAAAVVGGALGVLRPPSEAFEADDSAAAYLTATIDPDLRFEAAFTHPTDGDRYTTPHAGGARKPPKARRPWTEYESWDALARDEGASAEYMAARTDALNDLKLDWGPVLDHVRPLLAEPREYIGIVNARGPGRDLYVAALEASPSAAQREAEPGQTVAFIPAELVQKYANTPGLFLFHTHPDIPGSDPLPTGPDISGAVFNTARGHFAAEAVISRFGVILYSLSFRGYKAIHEAKRPALALINLRHDVVAAHGAMRSWAPYKVGDQLDFFRRHQLMVVPYPSPAMVDTAENYTYVTDLEGHFDHELLDLHRVRGAHVRNAKNSKKNASRPRRDSAGGDATNWAGGGATDWAAPVGGDGAADKRFDDSAPDDDPDVGLLSADLEALMASIDEAP